MKLEEAAMVLKKCQDILKIHPNPLLQAQMLNN